MVELIGVRPDVKVRRRRQGRELVAPPQLCTRHCKPEGQGKKIPSFAGYMPGRCRPQALNHAPPGLRRSASVPYPAALYRSAGLSKDFRYWIPSRVSTVHPLVLFLKLSFIYFCIHFLVVLPSTCLLVVIVNEVRVPGSRCCRVWLVVEREPARR